MRSSKYASLVAAITGSPRYKFLQELHKQRHPSPIVGEPPRPKPRLVRGQQRDAIKALAAYASSKEISLPKSLVKSDDKQKDITTAFTSLIAQQPEKEIAFTVLDATFGMGNHTRALLRRSKKLLRVVGMDIDDSLADPFAVALKKRFKTRFAFQPSSLRAARNLFGDNSFDGIILDLNGPCTAQLHDDSRGFDLNSKFDGPCTLSYLRSARGSFSPHARHESLTSFLNTAQYEDLMEVFAERAKLSYRDANGLANKILRRKPFRGVFSVASVFKAAFGETIVDDVFLQSSAAFGGTSRIERDRSYRAVVALRERINNDREEFQMFVRLIPSLLKPLGRCAIVCSCDWQVDALRRFEAADPKMFCPRYPTDKLWIFQKHTKLAYPLKLDRTLGALPKVAEAPESDLASMMRQTGPGYDPEHYPS